MLKDFLLLLLLENHQHQDEELWRVRAMASLKSYFEEQCAKHGGADMIKVIMAFERWHCRGKLREELRVDELSSSGSSSGASASSSSSCLASLDPLLPAARRHGFRLCSRRKEAHRE